MSRALFAVPLRPGRRISPAQRAQATWLLYEWLSAGLDELAKREPAFIRGVRKYLKTVDYPGAATQVSRGTALSLPFDDCSGVAEVSMAATLHLFDRLTTRGFQQLQAFLAASGVRIAPRKQPRGRPVFVLFRGRILELVDRWLDDDFEEQRGLIGLRTPVTFDEDSRIVVDELPARERAKLNEVWKKRACQCPVCAADSFQPALGAVTEAWLARSEQRRAKAIGALEQIKREEEADYQRFLVQLERDRRAEERAKRRARR